MLACKDFPSRMGGRDHSDPMTMKVAKASAAYCSGFGQALRMQKSSTAPIPLSTFLDPIFWLVWGGPGQESEVGEVQSSQTWIQVMYKPFAPNSRSHSNGQVVKQEVWTHRQQKSQAYMRLFRPYGNFPLIDAASELSRHLKDWVALFRNALLTWGRC